MHENKPTPPILVLKKWKQKNQKFKPTWATTDPTFKGKKGRGEGLEKQQLRIFKIALTENKGLILSSLIGWLTTTCNPSFMGFHV